MTSEANVTKDLRLMAAQQGWVLWKNNSGAGQDDNGNFIRWGLANDSAQMNKTTKSSDLIGVRPVLITQEMVGQTLGQFVALECKHSDWRYSNSPREQAQLKFITIVNDHGGIAAFTTGALPT